MNETNQVKNTAIKITPSTTIYQNMQKNKKKAGSPKIHFIFAVYFDAYFLFCFISLTRLHQDKCTSQREENGNKKKQKKY